MSQLGDCLGTLWIYSTSTSPSQFIEFDRRGPNRTASVGWILVWGNRRCSSDCTQNSSIPRWGDSRTCFQARIKQVCSVDKKDSEKYDPSTRKTNRQESTSSSLVGLNCIAHIICRRRLVCNLKPIPFSSLAQHLFTITIYKYIVPFFSILQFHPPQEELLISLLGDSRRVKKEEVSSLRIQG